MDESYDHQIGVTWQINVYDSAGEHRAIGGALCIHPDGYLLTAYHVIEGEDVTTFVGRGRRMKDDVGRSFTVKYVAGIASLDLAILKIDSEEKFDFEKLTNEIEVTYGEEVSVHGHASFIPFSSVFAKVGYPYKATDLLSRFGTLDEDPECARNIITTDQVKKMNEIPTPEFRTVKGVLLLGVDEDDTHDVNDGLINLSPDLPLIVVDTLVDGGFSGCPVFGRRTNKLLGILSAGTQNYTYIIPVDVAAYFVEKRHPLPLPGKQA